MTEHDREPCFVCERREREEGQILCTVCRAWVEANRRLAGIGIEPRTRPQSIRDAVLVLKDAAIKDGVSDDVSAAIAFLDLLTRGS